MSKTEASAIHALMEYLREEWLGVKVRDASTLLLVVSTATHSGGGYDRHVDLSLSYEERGLFAI